MQQSFIIGQLERSVPVILVYRTLKLVEKWLSYAIEKRFYPLTWGRRPDVIFQPRVKRRKTPFRVRYDLQSLKVT
jgi:hypothetical protein